MSAHGSASQNAPGHAGGACDPTISNRRDRRLACTRLLGAELGPDFRIDQGGIDETIPEKSVEQGEVVFQRA